MAGGHGVMVNDDCPQDDIIAVKVYTEPSASNGRYLECKKGKKTIACALHRWNITGKNDVAESTVNLGEFYAVSAVEGDTCVQWSKPGKDGVSTMKNTCAKDTTNALATCRVSRLKTLLPGGSAPRILECASGTYKPGKIPDDINCKSG